MKTQHKQKQGSQPKRHSGGWGIVTVPLSNKFHHKETNCHEVSSALMKQLIKTSVFSKSSWKNTETCESPTASELTLNQPISIWRLSVTDSLSKTAQVLELLTAHLCCQGRHYLLCPWLGAQGQANGDAALAREHEPRMSLGKQRAETGDAAL